MNAPNFFRLHYFQKMLSDELFTYANCSFDDFVLYGKSRKFQDSIERIFWTCFDGSDYEMLLVIDANFIRIRINNKITNHFAFLYQYNFNV